MIVIDNESEYRLSYRRQEQTLRSSFEKYKIYKE